MGKAMIALAVVGAGVGLIGVGAGSGYFWATSTANARLATTVETHEVDIPVPWPLTDEEIAELTPEDGEPPSEEELAAIAHERALARGTHLIESRFGCTVCHGGDFSGGVMMDVPAMFVLRGPNLTLGEGGVTADYTMTDWDRAVRHGVLPDSTLSAMPSEDFVSMSDQELSDVITVIRAQPPVDASHVPRTMGPMGAMLLATGALPLSGERVPDHFAAHAAMPPEAAVTPEFGKHLTGICTGCHNPELSGGPMPGGDPAWNDPANLTPHPEGLGEWTYDDFQKLMRTGIRRDGSAIGLPMSLVVAYTYNMTDVEMQALWAYLRTLPPTPTPQ